MIVAIVQISGEISANHQIDLQWELFWQQIEASISIIVVSITGFRTLLGMRAQKKRQQSENRWERLQSYRQRLVRRALHRNPVDHDGNANRLPSIPGATLTGMRTLINGGKSERDFVGSHAGQTLVMSTRTDEHDGIHDTNETSLISTGVCGYILVFHSTGVLPPCSLLTNLSSQTSGSHVRNTSAESYA